MNAHRSAEAFALRPAEASALPPAEAALLREDQLKLGLWMFLATVTMLFAAFTSAYVVRRSGSDWQQVPLPSVLWINSGVLMASSIAVELASRSRSAAARAAMGTAFALGVLFLGGQIVAWRQMAAAGVYVPTSPHSSFFFMLTGAHAVHVLAALAVLAWGTFGVNSPLKLSLCRTFWHYLGGVWIFLFALVTWL